MCKEQAAEGARGREGAMCRELAPEGVRDRGVAKPWKGALARCEVAHA